MDDVRAALWEGDADQVHRMFTWHQVRPHEVCGASLLRITAMTGSTPCATWVLATFGAQLTPQDIQDAADMAELARHGRFAVWLRRAAPRLRVTM